MTPVNSTAVQLRVAVPVQFLSKKLGADPVVFGYLETVFAVSMLLGGPIFGRFGDLFGARAALMVAFLSSFLTYAVLAVADSIFMLFISRLCAFMMHAMHGGCGLGVASHARWVWLACTVGVASNARWAWFGCGSPCTVGVASMHGGCGLGVASPTSVMSHACISVPGSQMVMTDVSGFKERADALGKLGVSYGVGMVIGKKVGTKNKKCFSRLKNRFS